MTAAEAFLSMVLIGLVGALVVSVLSFSDVFPWVCRRRGHDWFPDEEPREFIPVLNICLRCQQSRVVLPYGECLGGHPLAEHYDLTGWRLGPAENCASGGPS